MTIFAKIVAGEIPCHKIWEDDNHLAFFDIRPINKGHTLVIPKKGHDYIYDISAQEHQVKQPTTIDIAKDGIYLNGYRVSSRTFWEQQTQPIITDLYDRLLMDVPSTIQIRADAGVPWRLIDKTLATTRQAGCLDVTLLAISKDSL